jgi:hypothetical protein
MMKCLLVLFVVLSTAVNAQDLKNTITIEGRVKNRKVYTYDELTRMPQVQLDSLQVYSHTMVLHGTARHIKGVLLKEVLKTIEIDAETPKLLSEYYIVCMSTDNYKVVFSWNEIFNSPTGDRLMIALEKDGQAASAHKDGIVLVTPTDRATGRRFVKEFNKVIIQRVN